MRVASMYGCGRMRKIDRSCWVCFVVERPGLDLEGFVLFYLRNHVRLQNVTAVRNQWQYVCTSV